MKFFIDTANIEEIRQAKEWGRVDGVTTNPSLISKEKRPFKAIVNDICGLIDGPISVEAISHRAEHLVTEARELAKINPAKIVVKIPMTLEGMKAVMPKLAGRTVDGKTVNEIVRRQLGA